MESNKKECADKEYSELLELSVKKELERMEELKKKGLIVGLDGPDYCSDIREWFNNELNRIKDKYGVK